MFNPRPYVAALLLGAVPFSLPGISLGADDDNPKPKPSTAAKKSPTPAASSKKQGEVKKVSNGEKTASSKPAASEEKKTPPKNSEKASGASKTGKSEPGKSEPAKSGTKTGAKKPEPPKSETGKSEKQEDAPVKKSKKSKAKPKPATQKRRGKSTAEPARNASEKAEPEKKPAEPEKKPEERKPQERPAAQAAESGRAVPPPSRPAANAASRPASADQPQSVVVSKSGVAGEEEEPAPAPEPEPRHWWWPFGHSRVHYRYLTPRVREAIDDARVPAHKWRYIVVHNSGTRQGSAKAFDYYHRYVRKMPNGLAYHFVIGNGTSTPNGSIEIGPRWVGQLQGGHVHSDYLNSIALGVCLVGDYNKDHPTKEQLEALDELIKYLRKRVGKTDHHLAVVKPHRDINPPQWPTDCPGDRFPYQWLQSNFDE